MSKPELEIFPDGSIGLRGPKAPDVGAGDLVYWNETTEQFERVIVMASSIQFPSTIAKSGGFTLHMEPGITYMFNGADEGEE